MEGEFGLRIGSNNVVGVFVVGLSGFILSGGGFCMDSSSGESKASDA